MRNLWVEWGIKGSGRDKIRVTVAGSAWFCMCMCVCVRMCISVVLIIFIPARPVCPVLWRQSTIKSAANFGEASPLPQHTPSYLFLFYNTLCSPHPLTFASLTNGYSIVTSFECNMFVGKVLSALTNHVPLSLSLFLLVSNSLFIASVFYHLQASVANHCYTILHTKIKLKVFWQQRLRVQIRLSYKNKNKQVECKDMRTIQCTHNA